MRRRRFLFSDTSLLAAPTPLAGRRKNNSVHSPFHQWERERERETGAFLVDGLAKEAFDGLDSYRVFTASFQVSFIGFTVFNNKKPTTTTTFPLFMFALLVHFTHSSSLFFVVWWVCECVNRAVMRVRRVFIDRHVLIGRPIGRFERKNVEKIKV